MAVIHLNGETHEVTGADNLLQVCLSLGLDIPYFCWHPSLGSVGSCRQCAVKQYQNEEDMAVGKGRIVMSCMVETTSDLYISIDDDEAREFRESITELLMTNHPHDCPTCEEGGHCHLQDMTYMTHHDRREYRFTKRTHNNQYLGPFINHEMNRCIACYRCVRYYDNYAGGTDLGVFASASRVYFGRPEDGVLDSEFAGNLTEICPTGVFTDKTHSDHYTRKWDMQYAPSICQGCAVGCNTSVGERYGEVRRVENRYNYAVNGYFLCDRGRFGYDAVNRDDRPSKTLVNGAVSSVDTGIDHVAGLLRSALGDDEENSSRVVGIGSARASLETNHALKTLVGADNFSTGMPAHEQALLQKCTSILADNAIQVPTLKDIEAADCVLILGEDITQTAARVALAVRQAAKNKANEMTAATRTATWLAEPRARIGQRAKSPIYILDTHVTRLDDVAQKSAVATADEIAEFAENLAKRIGLYVDVTDNNHASAHDEQDWLNDVASGLLSANNPLIVAGTSLQDGRIIDAAKSVAMALSASHQMQNANTASDKQADKQGQAVDKQAAKVDADKKNPVSLYLVAPEVNSIGVTLLSGQPLDEILSRSAIDVLIVAENDLSYKLSDAQLKALLAKTKKLVVLDHQNFAWHKHAAVALPAASFAESDGTCVSAEGRAQRYFQVYEPSYYRPESQVVPSWRWLHAVAAEVAGKALSWHVLDDVIADLIKNHAHLVGIKDAAPTDDYRIQGLKIAREPRRYSGRTAMRAPISVHEPKQPVDADTALTYSMEGYVGDQTQSALIPFAWAPGWNSPQSWNKFQAEVGGHLKQGDAGVRLLDAIDERGGCNLAKFSFFTCRYTHADNTKPKATTTNDGIFLQPIFDLFSSGEMVRQSAVLTERATHRIEANAFTLTTAMADKLGVTADSMLSIIIDNQAVELPINVVDYLPENTIGYPKALLPSLSQATAKNIEVIVKLQAVGS